MRTCEPTRQSCSETHFFFDPFIDEQGEVNAFRLSLFLAVLQASPQKIDLQRLLADFQFQPQYAPPPHASHPCRNSFPPLFANVLASVLQQVRIDLASALPPLLRRRDPTAGLRLPSIPSGLNLDC